MDLEIALSWGYLSGKDLPTLKFFLKLSTLYKSDDISRFDCDSRKKRLFLKFTKTKSPFFCQNRNKIAKNLLIRIKLTVSKPQDLAVFKRSQLFWFISKSFPGKTNGNFKVHTLPLEYTFMKWTFIFSALNPFLACCEWQ